MEFFERFLEIIVLGAFAIFVVAIVIYLVGAVIDSTISVGSDGRLELKTVETECYDKNDHLIHELTCEKDVHCSKWGWAASYICDSEKWNQLSEINRKVSE